MKNNWTRQQRKQPKYQTGLLTLYALRCLIFKHFFDHEKSTQYRVLYKNALVIFHLLNVGEYRSSVGNASNRSVNKSDTRAPCVCSHG